LVGQLQVKWVGCTECGGYDHVHAVREGSDWLTPLLEALGSGLGLRRISMRNITYIENLPIPLHPTNQQTNHLTSGWLVDCVRMPPVCWLVATLGCTLSHASRSHNQNINSSLTQVLILRVSTTDRLTQSPTFLFLFETGGEPHTRSTKYR
jgi:hypothetical protein